ncbi:class I SAM-dependent methyltransferase [Streptomyces ureilyticus]|uniref:Class I SAM-dependent methyltransferase n=1 Tax=Streptomyces ureilyticus TaxID=1775131 RepID=A0ABX0DNG4_9ACTN|nr:class I SAM-dependent methyltransferase [Streptomyces ureilyticus]NGO43308.1 class I SAM-dependent methyltransferase [Streptomyces ureilyticus]
MTVGFSGAVAEYYAEFRRGYPSQVFDALQEAFELSEADVVLDVGCGTGQLALPFASRVRSVVGMDPEPDMLRLARDAADDQGIRNATWMLGADTDVPALRALMGERSLALTVIGQALHWMQHDELFRAVTPMLRRGGGIAVISNGTPLWLQDTAWSRALRGCLEGWFGTTLEASCGTSSHDRLRYAQALKCAGFVDVRELAVEYSGELSFDQLFGGVCSAIPEDQLPGPDDRVVFAERIRQALPADERFTEHVRVSMLVGQVGDLDS